MKGLMHRRRSLLMGAALAAGARAAGAQPVAGGRTVRLVVPFPPGGAIDILGRLLADRLSPVLGQSVVVENRSGAGGVIGADAVAKAPPDGATLGIIGVAVLCAAPFLYARMPFDPLTDLAPVTQITDGSRLCVVNADTAARRGWTDFRALIHWARANPEGVTMGSSGAGTSSHLNIEAINQAAGVRILHVPYRGGGPAINDLVSGRIDMMFDSPPALMPLVERGAVKALAVSTRQRQFYVPDVPGMGEFADLGLGDLDVDTWNAIMAPPGTPAPVIARLLDAVRVAATGSDLPDRLRPLGFRTVLSDTPAALAALIRADTPRWQRLVQISGAKLD
ncbi:Bug family tripartite tricarboxylate transporter substrate binding protein [Falsiroseomonas sp. CW058]|uniref:Bug family tripartite tricarboxylate transporter substrate binding protein n=1 Tax=Falsiroseomonas sp. CW058 TaxID=3388664 RepID=UPI003D316E30